MASSYYITYGDDRLTFPGATGSVAWDAPTHIYKVLWSTNAPFKNMYSITLNDAIENYDEYIVYGSANRDNIMEVNTQNRYCVTPGYVNQGGCFYDGLWNVNYQYILMNGTEMWLSGTSGYIAQSYFMGQNNGATTWTSFYSTAARQADVHPYKIVGIKEVK